LWLPGVANGTFLGCKDRGSWRFIDPEIVEALVARWHMQGMDAEVRAPLEREREREIAGASLFLGAI
jgi:hypothetical protein